MMAELTGEMEEEHPTEAGEVVKVEESKTSDIANSTATVKILVMPEEHMMTMAFTIGITIQDLKNHFANELRVPPDIISITLNGETIEENKTLMDLGVQPHGTVQFEMSSLDPENHPIKPVKPQHECSMPDVITVRVQSDTDTFKDVVVEIERTVQKKPFLGGYRHKITKTEFHHAAIQTIPKRRPDKGVETFCRDTQTVELRNKLQQCTNHTSTQMTKQGCYMSEGEDKFITPGTYITADEYHSKRLKAIITIQKYTRRWLAMCLVAKLWLAKEWHLAYLDRQQKAKIAERKKQIADENYRRKHPEKREDFILVFSALEDWKQKRLESINATLSGAERKAALCALQEEEAEYIAYIGRRRTAAGERNQIRAVQAFLNKCAAPKKWKRLDGAVVEMETQESIRAKELRDLYASINQPPLSKEGRFEALQNLQITVTKHECLLTQKIVELIDREADLLMRGVKEIHLEGLRKRICTLFLQYTKIPAFNPQAAKFLQVHQDPAKLKNNIHFCHTCHNYLPASDFALSVTVQTLGSCRRCSDLHNEARLREDFSLYKAIHEHLRKTESKYDPDNKIPYILQEVDLKYLVEVVWMGKSLLSNWKDLHDLVLVRWDSQVEWSPWNCILLTKDEAVKHLAIESLEETYGSEVIRCINYKHIRAQMYFKKIPKMVEYLRESGSKSVRESLLMTV